MLLAGAAHLGAAAVAIWRADQVIATDGVVTAQMIVAGPAYATPAQRSAFYAQYLVAPAPARRARRGHGGLRAAVQRHAAAARRRRRRASRGVGARGERRRRLLRDARSDHDSGGRLFSDAVRDPDGEVAVVNARFAAMHGGEAGILERRLQVAPSATEEPGGTWRTVVGVTPSVRQGAPPDPEPVIYLPLAAEPPANVYVMVRAASGTPVAQILRDELQALDGGLPLYGWQPLAWYSEMSRLDAAHDRQHRRPRWAHWH